MLAVMVVLSVLVVAAVLALGRGSSSHSTADPANDVDVSTLDCATNWTPPAAGTPTFTVRNTTPDPFEVDLLGPDEITVFGAVETLGPHTEVPLPRHAAARELHMAL